MVHGRVAFVPQCEVVKFDGGRAGHAGGGGCAWGQQDQSAV